jgi:hypothetical protein
LRSASQRLDLTQECEAHLLVRYHPHVIDPNPGWIPTAGIELYLHLVSVPVIRILHEIEVLGLSVACGLFYVAIHAANLTLKKKRIRFLSGRRP